MPPAAMKPMPANHEGRPVESCQICHKSSGPTPTPGGATPGDGGPKAIPHPIDGDAYKDCTTCHGADKLKPFPANHASFAADSCTACHKPAAAAPHRKPVPRRKPARHQRQAAPSRSPTRSKATTYKDCTTCHGADKMKPFPANHASFATIAAQRVTNRQHPTTAAAHRPRLRPQADPAPDRRRCVQGLHLLSRHGQDQAVPGEPRQLRDR